MPSKRKRGLTQEEIWDDSALIHSWDEALEEYKLYHSIHARGENVDEVLQAAEREAERIAGSSPVKSAEKGLETNGNGEFLVEDGGYYEENGEEVEPEDGELEEDTSPPSFDQASKEHEAPQAAEENKSTVPAPSLPPALPLSKDENDPLRNLMMSWYYAGYYTGLYEGQQQAKASK